MSLHLRIYCDHKGCPNTFQARGTGQQDARSEAREAGWKMRREPEWPDMPDYKRARDYCPDHADRRGV